MTLGREAAHMLRPPVLAWPIQLNHGICEPLDNVPFFWHRFLQACEQHNTVPSFGNAQLLRSAYTPE